MRAHNPADACLLPQDDQASRSLRVLHPVQILLRASRQSSVTLWATLVGQAVEGRALRQAPLSFKPLRLHLLPTLSKVRSDGAASSSRAPRMDLARQA